jgi:hypothetical protein
MSKERRPLENVRRLALVSDVASLADGTSETSFLDISGIASIPSSGSQYLLDDRRVPYIRLAERAGSRRAIAGTGLTYRERGTPK